MGDKQNTYKEINEKYAQKLDAYIRKRDSLRERIIDLKSRIEKLEKQEMRWFDIPFAYDPWWINKLNKNAKENE